MKNWKKLISMSLLVVALIFITGCEKREEIKFNGEEGNITFSLKTDKKYRISTDKNDFRTSREEAMLLGNGFKIGIEFDHDYGYFYKSDWKELIKKRKDNEDFKEVTYSDIKGIQYFYSGYMRYNVILQIKDSQKYCLVLTVYGEKATEEAAKNAINNKEVIDILNHITSITAKK